MSQKRSSFNNHNCNNTQRCLENQPQAVTDWSCTECYLLLLPATQSLKQQQCKYLDLSHC